MKFTSTERVGHEHKRGNSKASFEKKKEREEGGLRGERRAPEVGSEGGPHKEREPSDHETPPSQQEGEYTTCRCGGPHHKQADEKWRTPDIILEERTDDWTC